MNDTKLHAIAFRNEEGNYWSGFDRAGEPLFQKASARMYMDESTNVSNVVRRYPFLVNCVVVNFEVELGQVLPIQIGV